MTTATVQARNAFEKRGGTMSTGEALAAGIHPRTLYAMRDAGELEPYHAVFFDWPTYLHSGNQTWPQLPNACLKASFV